MSFFDPTGQERRAYLLASGTFLDPTRHSALYISDTGKLDGSGTVFSLGGRTNGVADFADYLEIQESNGTPTRAFELDLTEKQIDLMESNIRTGFREASNGSFVTPPYDAANNNCTQFCYQQIQDVATPGALGSVLGLLARVIEGTPVFTNQTLAILSGYGLIDFFGGESVKTDEVSRSNDTRQQDN